MIPLEPSTTLGVKQTVSDYIDLKKRPAILQLSVFKNFGKNTVADIAPVAHQYYAVSDVSFGVRGGLIPFPIGVDSCMGATVSLNAAIGACLVYQMAGQIQMSQKLGDGDGVRIAIAKLIEGIALTLGGIVNIGLRLSQVIKDFFSLPLHGSVLAIPQSLSSAISGFGFALCFFFGVFFGILGVRTAVSLYYLYRGRELRCELSKERYPIEAIKKRIEEEKNTEMRKILQKGYKEILLQEASMVLKQIEKKGGKKGLVATWKKASPAEKEKLMVQFLQNHPEYLGMKDFPFKFKVDPLEVDSLARAGRCLAERRVMAKLELKYERLLGSDVMNLVRSGEEELVTVALESCKKEVLLQTMKVVLCCVGLAIMVFSCVSVFVFTGGMAPLVMGILTLVSALLWIAVCDGKALLADPTSQGKFGKANKAMLTAAVVLNVLALCGVVTFLVLSGGGVGYIIPLIVIAFWMAVNLRGIICWYRFEIKPWECLEKVSSKVFHKFTQFYDEESLEKKAPDILKKMSEYDRKNLCAFRKKHGNWKTAANAWQIQKQEEKKQSFELLFKRLNTTFNSLQPKSA